MATIFKYNNKIYQAVNLDKKLKRLKISKDDIDILLEKDLNQDELEKEYLKYSNSIKEIQTESWHNPKLYYFINPKNNYSLTSIYDECPDEYIKTTLEELQKIWNS